MEADILSRYAWEARYPGFDEPIVSDEHGEAVQMAEAVLALAATQTGQAPLRD